MGVVIAPAGTRALGVDLGERRIGLALSDPSRTIASPHDVLRRSGDPAADRRAILALALEVGAGVIVVGLPLSLSGKRGPAARAARDEVEAMRAIAGDIEIVLHDERLTTVTAERALIEGGVRRVARRQVIDKVAAAVMLQSWLERAHP
ncbi:MAG: putative pre6S rRNA nuclease [Actinomycetota bacterium]|nr:putative pre6S rRNA nuclease [Actinomycetota bacterium]